MSCDRLTRLGRRDEDFKQGIRGFTLIELLVANAQLWWPTNMAGFSLQSTTNLAPSNWQPTTPPSVLGDQNVVSVPVSGNQFFRLIK